MTSKVFFSFSSYVKFNRHKQRQGDFCEIEISSQVGAWVRHLDEVLAGIYLNLSLDPFEWSTRFSHPKRSISGPPSALLHVGGRCPSAGFPPSLSLSHRLCLSKKAVVFLTTNLEWKQRVKRVSGHEIFKLFLRSAHEPFGKTI